MGQREIQIRSRYSDLPVKAGKKDGKNCCLKDKFDLNNLRFGSILQELHAL